jgi:Tfp pilus assembly protein PilV
MLAHITKQSYIGPKSCGGFTLLESLLALLFFSILATTLIDLQHKSIHQINKSRAYFLQDERLQKWREKDLIMSACTISPDPQSAEATIICSKNGRGDRKNMLYFIVNRK